MLPVVEVAVGIIFNKEKILVAQRQAHQEQGTLWEFPGGKIEPGESVGAALKRELFEEIGIEVISHQSWMEVFHDYPKKIICLKVHKVDLFSGEVYGKEGQIIQWVTPEQLKALPLLKANQAIVQALCESAVNIE